MEAAVRNATPMKDSILQIHNRDEDAMAVRFQLLAA